MPEKAFQRKPAAQRAKRLSIGPNLVTLLTVLRQQMGVSYRKLSQLCTETLQIPLSAPAVMGIINRFSQKCAPIYKGIEASLPTLTIFCPRFNVA